MTSEPKERRRSYSEAQDMEWSTAQTERTSPRRAFHHLFVATVITGVIIFASFGSQAFAKGGRQVGSQPPSGVDPHAIDALKMMGTYLRTLQSFQVEADLSTDDVMDDGQVVQSSSKVNLLAARPNRLRVEVTGDSPNRLYLYDGKNFTIYGQFTNDYATVPAPPTIAELMDKLSDRFDIDLPLVDLFRWGVDEDDTKKIRTAVDIGLSAVDGVTCEQYAFHQDDIDWQIWIQLGQYPLPRKLVIRTLTDEAKPQHSEVLTWNLAPSFNDAAFIFDPPPDAHRIVIADAKAQSTEKGK
jgi:hypothetical protein